MAALMFAHSWQTSAADQQTADKVLIMDSFWDYIAQTLTGFLFFMLGVAVGSHEFVVTLWSMLAAVLLLLLSRMLIVYCGFGILWILRRRLSLLWQNVIMLSGLRGPVSAALILTLPESFPYKGEFQCLAFVVIAASLILQPLLIELLLQRSKAYSSGT